IRRLRGGAARPAMQQAGGNAMNRQSATQAQGNWQQAASPAPVPAAPVDKSWFIPSDFDTPAFLANAKERFTEIQAVWDSGDIERLREFMTDDLVAEVKPEILARSGQNVTEVVL